MPVFQLPFSPTWSHQMTFEPVLAKSCTLVVTLVAFMVFVGILKIDLESNFLAYLHAPLELTIVQKNKKIPTTTQNATKMQPKFTSNYQLNPPKGDLEMIILASKT